MNRSTPLKIGINAQIIPHGHSGGTEQFIKGLIFGLGQLDSNEKYIIKVNPNYPDWLNKIKSPNQEIVVPKRKIKDSIIKFILPHTPMLKGILGSLRKKKIEKGVIISDFWNNQSVDVVHFPYQYFEKTGLPSIFNPHDLQHEHHPEFFSDIDLKYRKYFYAEWAKLAKIVIAESNFARKDLIKYLYLNQKKVITIYRGTPISIDNNLNTEERIILPKEFNKFIFYPAQTYPHKNHINLIKAIHYIKENYNIKIYLVCSGKKNYHWPEIKRSISNQGLEDQIYFTGYVSKEQLYFLYSRCQFVVFPTLFEGGGFPLLEAYSFKKAICCSNIEPIREIAGDEGALYFDQNNFKEIGERIYQLFTDEKLKEKIIKIGSKIKIPFNWISTAKKYRSLYRFLGNAPLSEEDKNFLGDSGLL